MSFYIKGPDDDSNILELWASARLPFEPKGWLYDMRRALIEAIAQFKSSDNAFLQATYYSEVLELCDLDNVLLYNVGTGKFKNICHQGLLLERSLKIGPHPTKGSLNYPHYHRYEILPQSQNPTYWNNKKTLAYWKDILMVKLTSDTKPHVYWKAMKENEVTILTNDVHCGYFGLDIQVTMPERKDFNLAAMVKPMLDGIIAAFHVHNGTKTDLVSERLARLLSTDAHRVTKLLYDNSCAVLGNRNMLHPFQNSVQWNPADDKCVALKVTCQKSPEIAFPTISGFLYAAATERL